MMKPAHNSAWLQMRIEMLFIRFVLQFEWEFEQIKVVPPQKHGCKGTELFCIDQIITGKIRPTMVENLGKIWEVEKQNFCPSVLMSNKSLLSFCSSALMLNTASLNA